ncbi:cytochrome c biogenesis heme-transporting ATPase CcmA [soil metagenome]
MCAVHFAVRALTEQRSGILAAENLQLRRGDRDLFDDLSFELRPGTVVHVRGVNGAGKTSLLRILCGFSVPDDGRVLWRGRRIEHARAGYHRELAWLGHRDGLKPELNALENLRFSCGLRRRVPESALCLELERAGVGEVAQVPVRLLSAGQRRRVALARVFAADADIWLLDEPFTSLDTEGASLVVGEIAAHLTRGGLLGIATHRPLPEQPAARVVTVALG